MNFHSDEWIMERLNEHYAEAKEYFPEKNIVALCLQGSQNYGLDYEGSDVDSKLIVVPSFDDIVFARKPVSTTHVRANDEHIDFKDVRLMFETFRKQNINFIEVLFTPYAIINPLYAELWNKLIEKREVIAHYNDYYAVKAMRGVAMEKYYAMEHRYPSREHIIDKYGYDLKQLHHLVRIAEFLERYLNREPYEDCIHPKNIETLMRIKHQAMPIEEARNLADKTMTLINDLCLFIDKGSEYDHCNSYVDLLLDTVQGEIIKKAIKLELEE